ncbi:calpastatin-like isoform X6 [Myxocyprinus asiaticus]|uniref:calpastatin-like isoform X6 n=1 Tax=Myxocyprinus asiaticus TaxID=70543 RepID=UPI002223A17C|nr:calpastatin-like isoform X6 [Myxocyprinus asiaticus]
MCAWEIYFVCFRPRGFKSQQVTPTPKAQVSTAKPAQYEKGPMQSSAASVAVKPGTTSATQAAPSLTSTAGAAGGGGAASTAANQKGPSQLTQLTTVSKPTPPSPAKVPDVISGTGSGLTGGGVVKPPADTVKPKDPAQEKAQNTTVPSTKPGPAKVDAAFGKPSATTGLPGSGGQKSISAQKVQVEVGPPAAKFSTEAGDPFDALAGTLPSSKPVAPKVPEYSGPEVKESSVKPEKGILCGERDDTLPPGYRREDMEKKTPAGVPDKPKDFPKPISTDEALDSLSAGFLSSAPSAPKQMMKTETVGAVDARSNFAPPPRSQQKQQATSQPANVTKSPAPPADKKAKIEKLDSSMPMDALSALGDTLGAPEAPKKLPELKPGDIVDEKKTTSEKGVRVGEREDTLPPGYRFSEEELQKCPPPPKESSMDTDDALDILSGGFTAPVAAPVVKAPVPPQQEKAKPAGVPEKSKDVPKPKFEELSAIDALAGDFVAPAQTAHKVSSAVPKIVPPGPKQNPETDEDALSALGDTLGAPEPPKKLPELKPGDIVHEKDVTSEKGVRVGEREDTLPPDYRFSEEDLKKHPPPKKEHSLDTTEALDILSGDFKDAPAPSASKTPPSACIALEALSDDFVTLSSASKVQSAVSGPPHADRQLSEGTSSALDALSDTLADIKPSPVPAPVSPKAVVKEKDIVEERVSKPGERDDTLPPDHRFTEADRKAFENAKKKAEKDVKPKQKSMDDATALDLLSSDFTEVPTVKPSAPEAHHFTPEPIHPTHTAPGLALDQLAEKLIPNLSDSKPKDSKPKGKVGKPKSKSKKHSTEDSSAVEQLSGQLSSDVVPSSSAKGGKR